MNNQIQILLIIIFLHQNLKIALLALRVLLNQSLRLRPMLKLMLIYLRQKKVKKEHSTITSLQKKKSKTLKSHKVKDIETPPLASIPISKKKKQKSKFPLYD